MLGGMRRQNIDLPGIMAKICALVVRKREVPSPRKKGLGVTEPNVETSSGQHSLGCVAPPWEEITEL